MVMMRVRGSHRRGSLNEPGVGPDGDVADTEVSEYRSHGETRDHHSLREGALQNQSPAIHSALLNGKCLNRRHVTGTE